MAVAAAAAAPPNVLYGSVCMHAGRMSLCTIYHEERNYTVGVTSSSSSLDLMVMKHDGFFAYGGNGGRQQR